MKRFSWRELIFLLAAPLCLLGLGIWGPQLREQWWPTQPRIECEVRPPTPMEIAQGAQIGVTARAIIPNAPKGYHSSFRYYATTNLKHTNRYRYGYSQTGRNYATTEEYYAYSWPHRVPGQETLVAEVNLIPVRDEFPAIKKHFQLPVENIALPDPAAVRRSNFRVTKAVLMYRDNTGKNPLNRLQQISFHIENTSDESRREMATPECVDEWVWQDGERHLIYASAGGEWTTQKQFVVDVLFYTKSLQVPPSKGTKISGLLSINHGWPQEITVEWPEKLMEDFAQTEMKFTTKLAPLPSSLPDK